MVDQETQAVTDLETAMTTTKLYAQSSDRFMMYNGQAMTEAEACSYLAAIPL